MTCMHLIKTSKVSAVSCLSDQSTSRQCRGSASGFLERQGGQVVYGLYYNWAGELTYPWGKTEGKLLVPVGEKKTLSLESLTNGIERKALARSTATNCQEMCWIAPVTGSSDAWDSSCNLSHQQPTAELRGDVALSSATPLGRQSCFQVPILVQRSSFWSFHSKGKGTNISILPVARYLFSNYTFKNWRNINRGTSHPVVKRPLANARDTGSIPGSGRSHIWCSN